MLSSSTNRRIGRVTTQGIQGRHTSGTCFAEVYTFNRPNRQALVLFLTACHILCCREVPQARSLEKDWRSSKGKPGSAPGPSSKEWANYRSQAHEGHSRAPNASEQPERQPHARHRHARNNPEWMADGAPAGSEDASGLSAVGRRAKDFEAERQRMKEEWKQEQTELRGAAYQPVSTCLYILELLECSTVMDIRVRTFAT